MRLSFWNGAEWWKLSGARRMRAGNEHIAARRRSYADRHRPHGSPYSPKANRAALQNTDKIPHRRLYLV